MARDPQTITITLTSRAGVYQAHMTGWQLEDRPGGYGSTWVQDFPLAVAETASAREVLRALAIILGSLLET
jgi:hypothetical protein